MRERIGSPAGAIGSVSRFWLRWRLALVVGFGAWAATRVGLGLVTYGAMIFAIPHTHPEAALPSGGLELMVLLSHWLNYDSAWYLGIATHGYYWPGGGDLVEPFQPTAFFPLYPLLIKWTASGIGHLPAPAYGNMLQYPLGGAALIVSNVSALVGFVAVAALAVQERLDQANVVITVLLLAAYPVAFYLAAGYSDATLLATAALSLLFARRGNWIGAGVAAALAGLTRAPGICMMLPIAWEYGRQHHWWSPSEWREAGFRQRVIDAGAGFAVILAAPAGTAGYMVFLWSQFGDPLLFVKAEHLWGRRTVPPWEMVQSIVHALQHLPPGVGAQATQTLIILHAGLFLSFIVIVSLSVRLVPVSFSLCSAGFIMIAAATMWPVAPDPLTSTGRYLLAAFPVFLALGQLIRNRPGWQAGLVAGGFLLQSVFVTAWVAGTLVD